MQIPSAQNASRMGLTLVAWMCRSAVARLSVTCRGKQAVHDNGLSDLGVAPGIRQGSELRVIFQFRGVDCAFDFRSVARWGMDVQQPNGLGCFVE